MVKSKINQTIEVNYFDNNWDYGISGVSKIAHLSASNTITLFTVGSNFSKSILHDFGISETGEVNSIRFMKTTCLNLTEQNFVELFNDDSFYLGLAIVINKALTNEEITQLIACWDRELTRTGLEFFRLDCDGHCLTWNNPPSLQIGNNLIKKVFPEIL